MSTSAEQKKIVQQCEHTHQCEATIDYLQQNRENKQKKYAFSVFYWKIY